MYFFAGDMDEIRQQRQDGIPNLVLERKRPAHCRCFCTSSTMPQSKHIATWEQLFDIHSSRFRMVSQKVRAAVWHDHKIAAHDQSFSTSFLKFDPTLTALDEVKVSVILAV